MALMRGRLFAGALFAGALFGQLAESVPVPVNPPVSYGGGGGGYSFVSYHEPDKKLAEVKKQAEFMRQLHADDEIIIAVIMQAVTQELI